MLISVCIGYYDINNTLQECGVVYDRKDDGKEEESVSHGYCPKCFRAAEDVAEVFFNRPGSKTNMY